MKKYLTGYIIYKRKRGLLLQVYIAEDYLLTGCCWSRPTEPGARYSSIAKMWNIPKNKFIPLSLSPEGLFYIFTAAGWTCNK